MNRLVVMQRILYNKLKLSQILFLKINGSDGPSVRISTSEYIQDFHRCIVALETGENSRPISFPSISIQIELGCCRWHF